jgi:glycosyltransferase involved in cell wall biosynthesis
MPFASFVVPTLGRPSLIRAVQSIEEQTDPDWEAMIVFDASANHNMMRARDPRFHISQSIYRSAGENRNYGIRMVSGEWVCFLDDDDHIAPQYVELLRETAEQIDVDIVIFRMSHPVLGILPDPQLPEIAWGKVGISFAVRDKWLWDSGLRFIAEDLLRPGPEGNEDINFLMNAKKLGARIHISPYVTYFVRHA